MSTPGVRRRLTFTVDGKEVTVIAHREGDELVIDRDGVTHRVRLLAHEKIAPAQRPDATTPRPTGAPTGQAPRPAAAPAAAPTAGGNTVVSPMVGVVKAIEVRPGDKVAAGERVVLLEAMKMDIDVVAPMAGTVESILVSVGDSVADRQGLVQLQVGAG